VAKDEAVTYSRVGNANQRSSFESNFSRHELFGRRLISRIGVCSFVRSMISLHVFQSDDVPYYPSNQDNFAGPNAGVTEQETLGAWVWEVFWSRKLAYASSARLFSSATHTKIGFVQKPPA
jgi:hypothetical protein